MLQRARLAHLLVDNLPDNTHAAAIDLADQSVLAAQYSLAVHRSGAKRLRGASPWQSVGVS
jgi:hypothetical protein